jgi:hypothetical protein
MLRTDGQRVILDEVCACEAARSGSPPSIPQFLHEETRFADCAPAAEQPTLAPASRQTTMEGVTL